jgi:hypothetical protein
MRIGIGAEAFAAFMRLDSQTLIRASTEVRARPRPV